MKSFASTEAPARPRRRGARRKEQGKMLVEGKVAIVTGAARGIGRATATRLAREGAAVVAGGERAVNE